MDDAWQRWLRRNEPKLTRPARRAFAEEVLPLLAELEPADVLACVKLEELGFADFVVRNDAKSYLLPIRLDPPAAPDDVLVLRRSELPIAAAPLLVFTAAEVRDPHAVVRRIRDALEGRQAARAVGAPRATGSSRPPSDPNAKWYVAATAAVAIVALAAMALVARAPAEPAAPPAPAPSGPPVEISAEQSRDFIGQRVRSCGVVGSVKRFASGYYLNLGPAFPNQHATLVIWEQAVAPAEARAGALPNLSGKTVCGDGYLRAGQSGPPQIDVRRADQLIVR